MGDCGISWLYLLSFFLNNVDLDFQLLCHIGYLKTFMPSTTIGYHCGKCEKSALIFLKKRALVTKHDCSISDIHLKMRVYS